MKEMNKPNGNTNGFKMEGTGVFMRPKEEYLNKPKMESFGVKRVTKVTKVNRPRKKNP